MKSFDFRWPHSARQEYRILQTQDQPRLPTLAKNRKTMQWSLPQALLTGLLCAASSLGGFALHGLLGDKSVCVLENNLITDSFLSKEMVIKVFEFNDTYSAAPSEESNRAWAENLPLGKGFMIEHSQLSNISEFSVFHQLHCIDTLRHGYYAALSHRNAPGIGETQAVKKNHHVTHCFDFLRQCIECAADTNIEPVDWNVNGVTGWGFERTCKDFAGLKRHAKRWRVPGIE